MHEKAVLGTMFQIVFTPCLQIPLTNKDKKQPFCRVITNFFVIADKAPYLIATGKWKVHPLLHKNFYPSPIWIKTGFWKGVLKNDLQFVYKTG